MATDNEKRQRQLIQEAELIQGTFRHIQSEAVEIFGYLKFVSMVIRQHLEFVNVNSEKRFIPTPLQQMVLNHLVGQAMTQREIMTELDIGSKETFNGKGGKGGMKELIEHALVKNDRRKGGYYRPDSPRE